MDIAFFWYEFFCIYTCMSDRTKFGVLILMSKVLICCYRCRHAITAALLQPPLPPPCYHCRPAATLPAATALLTRCRRHRYAATVVAAPPPPLPCCRCLCCPAAVAVLTPLLPPRFHLCCRRAAAVAAVAANVWRRWGRGSMPERGVLYTAWFCEE